MAGSTSSMVAVRSAPPALSTIPLPLPGTPVMDGSAVEPDPGGPSRTAEHLLTAVADGDRQAFDELYIMFSGRVLGLAGKIVIDREQAKEVTQDVFLQLWQEASRFDPARGSATSWILRVAHARAVDRVRLCRNRTLRDNRYAVGNHVPEIDTVVESVLLSADRYAVRRALLTLTPIQRESILLAYFSGLTTAEIASRIGVLRATVKTRIRDGLLRLAAELDNGTAADPASGRGRN